MGNAFLKIEMRYIEYDIYTTANTSIAKNGAFERGMD